ncbi:hypothetical protein AD998_15945 [bacterium 336/3]|nr:hypothetical protein AD998_15945 [bacterium 336/3]
MVKNRLEAFSDGVLAIIVTIMVLELKVPESSEWKSLFHLYPKFLSYVLSFVMVLIYWNNHHHLFHSIHKINGKVMLANGCLLFMLSLQPFATAWMGETHFAKNPVIFMAIILLLSGASYSILVRTLIHANGDNNSTLAVAVGKDFKGNISLIGYTFSIIMAFWLPVISIMIFFAIALMWLIPDKRIEKQI